MSKWKQPIGYILTAGTVKPDILQKLTQNCLSRLERIGLNPVVIICDQGSNNRSFLQRLEGVSIEKPYIVHNSKKVFIMYDPPHLLKNIRNNFMKANYKFNDVDIKWEFIVDFYNTDKAMSIRMAPKLTDKHIILAPFAAMRVNFAAQVLSHSVAAGINTLCALNHLPEEASSTAEFIETFDQLFNAFNSTCLSSSHKYKHALRENSGHIPFLHSCLRYLSKLKTGQNVVVPCIVGWQISINGLLGIWEELAKKGFNYLLTNRLNQDCLENLFSVIQQKGGFQDNPDPQEFRGAFRQVIVEKLFVHSSSANCEIDADKILLDISNVTVLKKMTKDTPQTEHSIMPVTLVAPPVSLEKRNVVAYMAGYLLKQYSMDDCMICKQMFQIEHLPETSPLSAFELVRFKESTGKLTYASTDFINFVQSIETLFCSIFGGVMHMSNLLLTLCITAEKEVMQVNKCGNPVCLHRIHDSVRLFMIVHIHHAIKMANIGRTYGHKRNRKMLKLCHE